MPEPMNDNARIVREVITLFANLHPWPLHSDQRAEIDKGLAALTALESELATAQADLKRARGTQAAQAVLAERRRQIEAEGWTPEHDDQHTMGELADAAACYARSSWFEDGATPYRPSFWPWEEKWWKPTSQRQMLVKAGALILAEIERLDRAALAPEQKP